MLSQTLSCFQNVDLYKKNSYNILKCWQRKSKNHTFTYLQFLKNAVQPDSTGEGTALSYIRGAAGTHTVWQSTNIVVSSIAYFKQTSFYQAVKLSLKKLLFFLSDITSGKPALFIISTCTKKILYSPPFQNFILPSVPK